MALIKLVFKPGVNRDQTNYTNEGGWWECDKIRFRSGFPQKLGGWKKSIVGALRGVCRQLFNYVTSFNDNLLWLGTSQGVFIEVGGNLINATPIRATFSSTDTDNCFDTTTNSNLVTVNIIGHGASAGEYVTFEGATFVGGFSPLQINTGFVIQSTPNADSLIIEVQPTDAEQYTIVSTTLAVNFISHGYTTADVVNFAFTAAVGVAPPNGNYAVNVLDADNFEITIPSGSGSGTVVMGSVATATTSGGGTAIDALFDIPPGPVINEYGYGWGAGGWGRGGWGSGTLVPITNFQRDWWFDNFDNDTVMNIRNGEIYYWVYNATFATRAVLLSSLPGASDVPNRAMQTLVSQNDKHLLAFGCQPFGGISTDFDPLLIRWADQDTPTNWTPSPTNSAGFLRVSRGSKIVRALPTRQEILVWTDTHLYTLQFLGTADVFGVQEYADNISIAGPRAVTSANNVTYWMGVDKFYSYSGRVETLPCTLRNHVFSDFNFEQIDQVVCGTNQQWHEVWWFYPTANSQTNDAYVVFNYLENIWYYGYLNRTSWLDTPLRKYPQATCCVYLYNHEDGVDADDLPMNSFITSSDFDLSTDEDHGNKFILTKRIIPDISFQGSEAQDPQVLISLRPRNFPGAAYQTDEAQNVTETNAFPVEQYTEQIFMRARARQMAFKISSSQLGVQWQLGSPRLEGKPDGRR